MEWKALGSRAWRYIALIGLCGAIAPPAALAAGQADCLARRGAMIAAAYPDAALEKGGIVRLDDPARSILVDDIACARLPGADRLTAVLVPIRHETNDEWLDLVSDLEVLVFGNEPGAPRYRLLEPRLASEDAFSLTRLEVDTARYDVAGDAPVFGVRIQRSNASRANPATVSSLRLYRIAEGRIAAILTDLAVHSRSGEWNDVCDGTEVETWRDVLAGDRVPDGLADMTIVGRTVRTVISGDAEPCIETAEEMREEPAEIRFDGRRYPVPEALRGIDGLYGQ